MSFNGTALALHRQAEWVNLIRVSTKWSTRTVVVRRRQAVVNDPIKVQVHAASPNPKGEPAATVPSASCNIKTKPVVTAPAASGNINARVSKNNAVSQRIQRLEDGAKFPTSRGGTNETEAQKRLRAMKEEARRSRDDVQSLEKERLVKAKRRETERLEQEQVKCERVLVVATPKSAAGPDKAEEEATEHPSSVMVRLLDTALAKVEALETNLRLKNESHQVLEAEMDGMKCVKGMTEKEKQINRETNVKLSAADEKVKALEKEVIVKNDLNVTIQQECDSLRWELDELKNSEENSQEDLLQTDTTTSNHLRKELSIVKESEESLRKGISLLEKDQHIMEKERDDAKRQAEGYRTLARKLQEEVQEQLSAIDSLVDLLERQRGEHTKEIADRNDEIASLKKQLAVRTSEE